MEKKFELEKRRNQIKLFSYSEIKKMINLLDREKISMSKFQELINQKHRHYSVRNFKLGDDEIAEIFEYFNPET